MDNMSSQNQQQFNENIQQSNYQKTKQTDQIFDQEKQQQGDESEKIEFNYLLTSQFIKKMLINFPQKLDSVKIMIIYFLIASLDAIDMLECLGKKTQEDLIQWIYQQQIHQNNNNNQIIDSGFRSGEIQQFDTHHIVYTYSALNTLKMLGDKNLINVNKEGIIKELKSLQQENGSFKSVLFSRESDLRFVYSALVISHFLNDFSGIDQQQTLNYINKCQNHTDGAFGLDIGLESHGAATYCALVSLKLLNQLDNLECKSKLLIWLVNRQQYIVDNVGGFNGRINKIPDSCYTFWVGASLKILGYEHLINQQFILPFLKQCEYEYGGFMKFPDATMADPNHTLHSIYGIKIMEKSDKDKNSSINFEIGIKDSKI